MPRGALLAVLGIAAVICAAALAGAQSELPPCDDVYPLNNTFVVLDVDQPQGTGYASFDAGEQLSLIIQMFNNNTGTNFQCDPTNIPGFYMNAAFQGTGQNNSYGGSFTLTGQYDSTVQGGSWVIAQTVNYAGLFQVIIQTNQVYASPGIYVYMNSTGSLFGRPYSYNVNPGAFSSSYPLSTVTLTGLSSGGQLAAGSSFQLKFICYDQYGNTIYGCTGNNPSMTIAATPSTYDYDYSISVLSPSYSIIITITPYAAVTTPVSLVVVDPNSGYQYNVNFTTVAGNFNTANSKINWGALTSNQLTVVDNPNANDRVITITPRDSYNNIVLPQTALGQAQNNQLPFQCMFTLHVSTETTRLPFSYTFYAAYNVLQPSYFFCEYQNVQVAGQYLVQIVDGYGQAATESGIFNILPGVPSGNLSLTLGLNLDTVKVVGQQYSFVIRMKDIFGNFLLNNVMTYSGGTLNLIAQLSSLVKPLFVDINLVDYNNGTFGASYLLSFSGEYILGVYYLHDSVGDSGSIIESDAQTDGALSIAYGDGLSTCKASTVCRFVVQAHDIYNNNQTSYGDNVVVSFDNGVIGTVQDYLDGYYGVSYTISGPGSHAMTVEINNVQIIGSPFSVDVTPSDAAIGLIVVAVILFVVFSAIVGYIVYRRRQIKRLQREWALKRAAAYRDYRMGNDGAPPSLEAMRKQGEPEWDDEKAFHAQPTKASNDGENEWSFMQTWVNTDVKQPLPDDAIWDSDEMDALKSAAKKRAPGAADTLRPSSARNNMFKSGN